MRAAAESGADAVKLQTYTADTMTIQCDEEYFQLNDGPWKGYNLYQLYEEAHTPWEWHEELFALAEELGVLCFSTPFDPSSVEFLEKFNPPCYKLASFELIDVELIKAIAQTGKPVIFSVGMGSLPEIQRAVDTFRKNGCTQLIGLKCVSSYPADPASFNLKTIPHLGDTFDVIPGLSDHSLSPAVATAAVALGARVVEKHFTLKRSDGGPDAAFSLEPDEFRILVQQIRDAEAALGAIQYGKGQAEAGSIVFRRSLFAVTDIPAGTPFTRDNVRIIRPGNGLPPHELPHVLQRTATTSIKRGTPLSWDLIGGPA